MSNGKTGTGDVHGDAEKASVKLPYAKPVLRIFGSVTDLTRGSGGSAVDGRMVNKRQVSDGRLKQNIVQVGRHPIGIGLYLFDYKPDCQQVLGAGRQFGVMADEVEEVMPSAVDRNADGYSRVDYESLGIVLHSNDA